MSYAKPFLGMVVLASLALTACSSAPGDVDGETGTAQQLGLSANGLSANGLSANGLSANGLSANGLSANGLSANGLAMSALTDPNARELLKYVVSCALPASAHVDLTVQGVHYSYPGQLGLAPEWGEDGGSCGKSCQQWVSACVLARVDYLGQLEVISLRGQRPTLVTSHAERSAYTSREATYYGNIFVSPQIRYACLSPDKSQIPRVCGPSIQGCVMDVVGSCDDVCGHARADGSFPDCWSQAGDDGHHRDDGEGESSGGAAEYHGSITVFLKP